MASSQNLGENQNDGNKEGNNNLTVKNSTDEQDIPGNNNMEKLSNIVENENRDGENNENREGGRPENSRKSEHYRNKNWVNEKLITASISHITRFSEEKLAMDLEKRNLWKDVTGLSVSGNRKIMEIEFKSRKSVEELLVNPLNTHQRSLAFREINSKCVTVSLLEVPLGYPMQDIVD